METSSSLPLSIEQLQAQVRELEAKLAHSNELMCNGCSSCERVCPYGAITYTDKEFRMPDRTTLVRRVATVNHAVCQGCGACTVACPSGAMDLQGFSNRQILSEVDAICR